MYENLFVFFPVLSFILEMFFLILNPSDQLDCFSNLLKKLNILNLMLIQVKVDLGEDINMYTLASCGFKPGKLFCSVFSRLQISSGSLIESVSIKENSSSVWIIYIFTTTDSGKNV